MILSFMHLGNLEIFYNIVSSVEHGTLLQLKNVIGGHISFHCIAMYMLNYAQGCLHFFK